MQRLVLFYNTQIVCEAVPPCVRKEGDHLSVDFFAKYSFKRAVNLSECFSSAGGGESLTPTLFNKLT